MRIPERQAGLDWLIQTHFREPEQKTTTGVKAPRPPGPGACSRSADEVINLLIKNPDRRAIFEGSNLDYASSSEADGRFFSNLAFFCEGDTQVMHEVAGRSGRVRPKWNERRTGGTWLSRELERAVDRQSETITPKTTFTVGVKQGRSNDNRSAGDADAEPPKSTSPEPHRRFERIDLGEPIESGMDPPEMLERDLLYAGSVHAFYSAGGSGKTLFALWLTKQVIEQDKRVILLDQENNVRIISERLRDLGVSAEQARRNLYYHPFPSMPLSEDASAEFEALLDEVKPELVVFDSWINFLASASLDENSAVDIALWADAYPQRARIRGIACLLLDHIPKEGNTARGSGRKLDYVDVMFELTKPQHFDRETLGRIDLRLKKDREGWLPWGLSFTVGGKDGQLVFRRTAFDSSHAAPDSLLPSDRKTLDALKSFGDAGARDKDWREEAMKRGLSRASYYRSRETLLEQGHAQKVSERYMYKTPANGKSHLVSWESHETNETMAYGGKSHESHHPKGETRETNQAETSGGRANQGQVNSVADELRRTESGAQKNLAHYLKGTTTLEFLTKSVMRGLGEEGDWRQWAPAVERAAADSMNHPIMCECEECK